MGRLGHHKSGPDSRPFLRVHYRKLVEDYADFSGPLSPLPEYFSYCCCRCGHTQKVKAEELNSIVGNAVRMAYAARLRRQPTFQELIASRLRDSRDRQKNSSLARTNARHRDPGPPGGEDPPESAATEDPAPRPAAFGSERTASPAELDPCRKTAEKPPLIRRLAKGLANIEKTEDSLPLVTPVTTTHPARRPLSGGYVNEAVTDAEFDKSPSISQTKQIEINSTRICQNSDQDLKSKRTSQTSSGSSGPYQTDAIRPPPPPPPPPPERTDSLAVRAEEGDLRAAPWFQAGIPREITLEVLGREPVGAFMVRESTSKPGCYALSLRVPRDFQPSGIAHYLIMRTAKGYKIKGFTKEFATLTALVTHHSVMPELLPCPLSLSRFDASIIRSESNRDFADTDSDPDYDTLADFRRMMADLNV